MERALYKIYEDNWFHNAGGLRSEGFTEYQESMWRICDLVEGALSAEE